MKIEGKGNFFEAPEKNSAETGRKLPTNVLKNQRRAFEKVPSFGTAAASRNTKAASFTFPDAN